MFLCFVRVAAWLGSFFRSRSASVPRRGCQSPVAFVCLSMIPGASHGKGVW